MISPSVVVRKGERPPFEQQLDKLKAGKQYRGLLEPNQVVDITATVLNGTPPGAAEIAALRRGDIVVYFGGMVRYRDIFDIAHWTKFCGWVDRDLHSIRICEHGNEIDRNQ
jgi:hypothetical protein